MFKYKGKIAKYLRSYKTTAAGAVCVCIGLYDILRNGLSELNGFFVAAGVGLMEAEDIKSERNG